MAPSWPICRRVRPSVPALPGGPRSCCCCARTSAACPSAATPTPGSARSRRWKRGRGAASAGELDAVVLAAAGLGRLNRLDLISQIFEPDEMLPAPGQGALAVEWLAADPALA